MLQTDLRTGSAEFIASGRAGDLNIDQKYLSYVKLKSENQGQKQSQIPKSIVISAVDNAFVTKTKFWIS